MTEAMNDSAPTSYGRILRSSSIIGGTNALNYLAGLVRNKVVAVLLGPAGVGLISLYTSAITLIGTVSGLGLGSSRVREVARTFAGAPQLVGLGLAFMWAALLTTGLDMATRALITRQQGLDAAGLYQSAWALSGLFAGFIFGAMGTDLYSRLTAAIQDRAHAVRLIDEPLAQGIAGNALVSSTARGEVRSNSC